MGSANFLVHGKYPYAVGSVLKRFSNKITKKKYVILGASDLRPVPKTETITNKKILKIESIQGRSTRVNWLSRTGAAYT